MENQARLDEKAKRQGVMKNWRGGAKKVMGEERDGDSCRVPLISKKKTRMKRRILAPYTVEKQTEQYGGAPFATVSKKTIPVGGSDLGSKLSFHKKCEGGDVAAVEHPYQRRKSERRKVNGRLGGDGISRRDETKK